MTRTTHNILRAAGLMMAANFLSRILGLLRNTAIAAWFGQNAFTDVYTVSFIIPDLLFFLFAGGVFSSAFVPVFTRYISDGEEEKAWEVFSISTVLLTLVIGLLVVLGIIFAPQLSPLAAPGFKSWQLTFMSRLIRILLPGQICFFLGALLMAVHYVKGRFLAPALGPIVYNLGILAGGWIGHYAWGGDYGVAGLAWGALAGAIMGNLILPLVLLRGTGVRFRFSLNLRHPGMVKVGKLALPVLIGLSLPQVFAIINRWFASGLSAGSATALERANQLMQAPLGIFAQGISVAIFPALAALAAQGQQGELQRTFSRGLKSLWFISLPLSLLMIVLAPDIVRILLQYRRTTQADASLVSNVLVFYCLGLFAFSCLQILNRIFYAVHDTLTPAIVGTISTVIFVALNFLLIGPMNARGLALAGSIAAIAHLAFMLLVLRWRTGLVVEQIWPSFLKITAAALVAGGVAFFVRHGLFALPMAETLSARMLSLASLFIVTALGGLAFVAMAMILRIEEMSYVTQILLRRFRRKAQSNDPSNPAAVVK